jgi:hypothetical protein
MKEAPENDKESLHSAHANGIEYYKLNLHTTSYSNSTQVPSLSDFPVNLQGGSEP